MMQPLPGLRAVMVWPRRNGKDVVCCNIMAAKMLQKKADYAYILPYQTQARSIVWEGITNDGTRFIDFFPPGLIERKLDQQMKIWFKNGSTLQLVGSDNFNALVGRNLYGIIFGEYSIQKPEAWQYLRPMLTANGGWAIFQFTPRGTNHAHDIYQIAESSPDWFCERLTADDTGYPSREAIEAEREAGMRESLIEQEFYTSFTASTEETLIPLTDVKKAFPETLPSESQIRARAFYFPRIMGIDPAFSAKGDRAVIVVRQGPVIYQPRIFQGIDPMQLASEAVKDINTHRPEWVFVDSGRGEAVWSRLHQLGYDNIVIPIDFGGKAHSDYYANRKTEMWDAMAKYFKFQKPVFYPAVYQADWAKDLSAPTAEINERGKLQIESKKSLKKRGYRSTDLGDALALTFAEDLDQADLQAQLSAPGLSPEELAQLKDSTLTPEILTYMRDVNSRVERSLPDTQPQYDPLGYLERMEQMNHGADY